jgi:hypothetical protein
MIKMDSIKEEMQELAEKYKSGMASPEEMIRLFKYWGMSDEGIKFRIDVSVHSSQRSHSHRLN